MTAPLLNLCRGCSVYICRYAATCWRCGADNPHIRRKAGKP